MTPETIASTIINSNFLNTACLPCAVSVQPGAARRAAAGQRRTCRFVQKRPRQGYFLVSPQDGLNGVKPILRRRHFRKVMGFAEPVIGPATSGRTRWPYPPTNYCARSNRYPGFARSTPGL
jgi:hypothetical protein